MKKIFSLFILVFSLMLSLAQQTPHRIRFEHLSVADGLPENSVRCMLQDHLGFLWLGTQNGLVRYDGNKMTTFPYHQGNTYGCRGKQIGVLMEDPHGDIWIGAENLIRFERATQQFIEYPDKHSAGSGIIYIRFIHQDKQGFIWTCRQNNDQNRLSRFDPKTNAWIYFSNDPSNPHYLAGSGMNEASQDFAEDKDGNIFLICLDQNKSSLQWLDRKSDKFIRYQLKIKPVMAEDFKKIWWISTDGQGILYFSSSGKGLFSLNTESGEVKQFRHDAKDPKSLLSDTTLSIYMDKTGSLLISNPYGLDRYNPRANTFAHYISKRGDLSTPGAGWANNFYETAEGDIWFQNGDRSTAVNFYHRKNNSFTRYEPDNKQEDALWGFIASILVDRTGMVWVGTMNSGLNKESRTSQFPLIKNIPGNTNSLQDDNVSSIYEAPSEPGIIWFGSEKGLDRLDKKTGIYTHYTPDDRKANFINKGGVTSITEDMKGRFWVSVGDGSLDLLDRKKGSFLHFAHDSSNANSLSSSFAHQIKAISDGTLWIGTFAGLDHFDHDKNKITHYQKADTSYTPLLFDFIDQYTTAERKVAAIVHPGNNVDTRVSFDLSEPAILLVTEMGENPDHGWIEDAKGRIVWNWDYSKTLSDGSVGRITAGVIHLNTGSYFLRYKSDDNYSYGHWTLPAPFHPNLWGIQVSRVNAQEEDLFNKEAAKRDCNGLGDDEILYITEDSKKNIWIGSNNRGIDKFDPASGKFVSYNNRATGPGCVVSINEDKKTGNFWVGDYSFGLLFMSPKGEILKTYNSSNGLSCNGVEGIQIDPAGILWITTDNGLCRFDPATEKFQLYNKNNGLPELKLSAGAFCQSADGEIYFGSIKGVNAFYPDQIKLDTTAAWVVLTDLDINGKPAAIGNGGQMPVHISMAKEIELSHDLNELNLHFASMLLNRGNESQFAYKLSPVDNEWVQSGTIRQARYSNLSPGNYTFMVKAANADGVWNETNTSIIIHILAPWWRTWWAYCLYALLIGSIVWTYIQYRSKALRKENLVLEQKVERRTKQLQESIESLKTTQAQLIQSEKMASLGELTAGIAHEIQNPLNFVNNFSEVNKELADELELEIDKGNYADAKAIAKDIQENEQKINHHGKRADAIVKGMLQHSRSRTGVKELTDINALAGEYLRLSYQGLKAKNKNFNATIKTDFDESLSADEAGIGNINVIPQDIGRALLNFYNNAFYAIGERQKTEGLGYEPTISVTTKKSGNQVFIKVSDNGNGIPQNIVDKIFQPFFTTKPTGQGTGLGLSLSYDIVKAHGGECKVDTKEGECAEFTIQLPISV